MSITRAILFHPTRRFLYRASMVALILSFVVGFATVLWREGRPPGIGLRHLSEITTFLQREDYAAALDRLRIATKIAPSDETAIYLMGVALQQVGDLAGAKAAYHQVLKFKPWHVDSHFRVGLIHLDQQNHEAAVWHNQIVVQLQPANERARTNLAVALLRQGKTAEAVKHLHETLRLHPGFVPAQKTLDQILARQTVTMP